MLTCLENSDLSGALTELLCWAFCATLFIPSLVLLQFTPFCLQQPPRPGQFQSWKKKLKAPREQPEGRTTKRTTKRTGPGLGGGVVPRTLQFPVGNPVPLAPLFHLFSLPYYLWEPRLHKGQGQPGLTKAMSTPAPVLSPSGLCLGSPTPFLLYIMSLACWDF